MKKEKYNVNRFIPSNSILGDTYFNPLHIVESFKGFGSCELKTKKVEKPVIKPIEIEWSYEWVAWVALLGGLALALARIQLFPHSVSNREFVPWSNMGSITAQTLSQAELDHQARINERNQLAADQLLKNLQAQESVSTLHSNTKTNKTTFLAIGGNFDVQVRLGDQSSNTTTSVNSSAFQVTLQNLHATVLDFQSKVNTLCEAINQIQDGEDELNTFESVAQSYGQITNEVLNFLKEKFVSEFSHNGYKKFGWTPEERLAANPQLCGLTVQTNQKKLIDLTRRQLEGQFFSTDAQSYVKFQTVLDSNRQLENSLINLGNQHKTIVEAKQNLNFDKMFDLIQQAENSLSLAAEIPPIAPVAEVAEELVPVAEVVPVAVVAGTQPIQTNGNSRPVPQITVDLPRTVSIQGYKTFSRFDLAGSVSFNSKLSLSVGKCKFIPLFGSEISGIVSGFDVGGAYTFSSKKFGPQANFFVGLGRCF